MCCRCKKYKSLQKRLSPLIQINIIIKCDKNDRKQENEVEKNFETKSEDLVIKFDGLRLVAKL